MIENKQMGIIFKILNILLFTLLSLFFVKHTPLGTAQSLLMACVWGVLMTIALIAGIPQAKFYSHNKRTYLYRSVCGLAAMWTWIEALKYMNPNNASALSYTTPIFTLLLAKAFFHERIHRNIWAAVALSIIGTLIVLYPSLNDSFALYPSIMAFISSILWAIYDMICKHQAIQNEHFITQAFYSTGFAGLIILPFALYQWQSVGLSEWASYSAIAGIRVANIIALFLAYKFAPIHLLVPYSYLRIVFMALLSFIAFGTSLPLNTCVGVTLIILASHYSFRLSLKS
jgi:drug/metabolite transporter (DMT)-like permease